MAKNEPNKPDDVKIAPENKAPTEEQTAPTTTTTEVANDIPAPELTAKEAVTLAYEGKAALKKMGEAEIEPSTPFDIGSKHIPDSGEVVVPFEKINEIVSEKQAQEAEKFAAALEHGEYTGSVKNLINLALWKKRDCFAGTSGRS